MKNTDFMNLLNEIKTDKIITLVGYFNQTMSVSNFDRQRVIKIPCGTIRYEKAVLLSDGVAILAHDWIICTIPTKYISRLEVL